MNDPRKRIASGGTLANSQSRDDDRAKRTGGRAENQGLLPQRCLAQSSPTWAPAPGTDAALMLARRMRLWRRL
jgi:hypothetical protein